jgi:hypothetical protein
MLTAESKPTILVKTLISFRTVLANLSSDALFQDGTSR